MTEPTQASHFMPRLASMIDRCGGILIALPFVFLAHTGILAEEIGRRYPDKDATPFVVFTYSVLNDMPSLLFLPICGVLCMVAAKKIRAHKPGGWKLWTSLCLASFLWWGYELPSTRALILSPLAAICFIHAIVITRSLRFKSWWDVPPSP